MRISHLKNPGCWAHRGNIRLSFNSSPVKLTTEQMTVLSEGRASTIWGFDSELCTVTKFKPCSGLIFV